MAHKPRTAKNFQGIHIPVISCFQGIDGRGPIDSAAQKRVLRYVIEAQEADGIIACATTGEAGSLSENEYQELARLILTETRALNPDIPVILGTTHINPRVVIERHQFAAELGFDGALVSHPPYMKPDQRGIYAFFKELAAAIPTVPIFIYNIWYRTGGKGIDANTLIELAQIPGIYGVKDNGVSLEHIDAVIAATDRSNFVYLSGDDLYLFDMLAHGGDGGILAAAHVVGREMKAMRAAIKQGALTEALHLHRLIKPVVAGLFMEPNPAPLKYMLNLLGLEVGAPRAPTILTVTDAAMSALATLLQSYQQVASR